MLFKRLTRDEVLEVLMMMASESLPNDLDGQMSADLDKDGNAEIFFTPKSAAKDLN